MSSEKPSIPRGTRDFGPSVMAKRKFIFNSIEGIYKKYGFLPLETPSMENLTVLTGKYGEEGDQLIFKILNSRLYEAKNKEELKAEFEKSLQVNINTPVLTERALRYDLTVPFARYVVMNRNEITFPFKRYQMQPVWRADKPQKGRYREFYQCDADVVGTDSLLCEAEIIAMINDVFSTLGIKNFAIKLNNRKILSGIAELADCKGKETDLCVAIDKLEKIGKEKVIEELLQKGFNEEALIKIDPIFSITGSNMDILTSLRSLLADSETGMQGIEEISTVLDYAGKLLGSEINTEIDITLARGLTYYTGAIFEVKAMGVSIGSISGGGRYDNLTGVFGLPGVSGVGISFGVDRIFDVMEELNLFHSDTQTSTQLLIVHFDQPSFEYGLSLLTFFRQKGIYTELYPDLSKMKKQMGYANSKAIPFVIIIGSDEIQSGNVTLKNMVTGAQIQVSREEVVNQIINH